MTRKLKARYSRSNECEVTGEVSTVNEYSEIELDDKAAGRRVFPDSNIEWLDGNLKIDHTTPTGVVIATDSQNYIVTEGEIYRTGIYTLDGRHNWWYTFVIVTE